MPYTYPFILTERIPFPKRAPDSVPFQDLLDRYLLNLIPVSPIHSEFAELVFKRVGLGSSKDLLGEWMENRFPAPLRERIALAEDVGDLVRGMREIMDLDDSRYHEAVLRKALADALRSTLGSDTERSSNYLEKLRRVREGLGLSFAELEIIEFCVCYQVSLDFMRYCDQYIPADWPALIAQALGHPPDEIHNALRGERGLLEKGLLNFTARDLDLYRPLLHYLMGLRADFVEPGFCIRCRGAPYPLESFPVPKAELELIEHFLKAPGAGHLLFYGRPGTGKTELAKALALKAGYDPSLLACGLTGSQRERVIAITSALAMASERSLFVLDEADSLLNTQPEYFGKEVDKSWVNHFLDTCPHKLIWITNDVSEIPASTLRRFAFSLRFTTFTDKQRYCTWQTHLKKQKLDAVVRDPAIKRLSRRYPTDAGAIASAVEIASRLYAGLTPPAAELEETLSRLLNHHRQLTGLRESGLRPRETSGTYDLKALNTDVDPSRLLKALKRCGARGGVADGGSPAAVLFWGLPGTGKTRLAHYLAEALDRPLVQKRMSDLQSKYVGGTEQRIAAAFREAEIQRAVLLLDEADSLLLDRMTARCSWESGQTNEVLTQLESFPGICICCTNVLNNLDRASLRRFTWKVEFRPLQIAGRERLYRRYFQPRGRLSAQVRSRLETMNQLTPGDFGVVLQQQLLKEEPFKSPEILAALEREQIYKSRDAAAPIGFHHLEPDRCSWGA